MRDRIDTKPCGRWDSWLKRVKRWELWSPPEKLLLGTTKPHSDAVSEQSGVIQSRPSNNFDGLRLIAALFVIVSHEFHLLGLPEPMVIGGHSLGNLGVLMFFSISGFLVTQSWHSDPDARRFITKRFLRIAPALFVVTTLLGYNVATNGPLWTIPMEFACYLALVGAARFCARPALPLALAFLATWAAIGSSPQGYHIIAFGLFFCMGAIVAEHRVLLSPWRALGLVLVGELFLIEHQTTTGLAFIVPPLTIAAGLASWPLLRSAGRWGDLSYGAYLIGWPIQKAVIAALGKGFGLVPLLLVTIPLALAFAYASWHAVEKQALSLKPRRN